MLRSNDRTSVTQGTVLGPMLFLLFINDLPVVVSSQARLFANDSLLYRTINNPSDQVKLQEDLKSLEIWEKPGRCPSTQTNASLSTSQRSAKQLNMIISCIIRS